MVFFELGNWGCGEDYPNEEPFLGWLKDDFNIKFMDEQWVIDNGLIVIASNVDMAFNFCITAPDGWVEKNCPSLFDNPEFLREPFENEDVPEGRFGCPFYSLDEMPAGLYLASEKEDGYYSVGPFS